MNKIAILTLYYKNYNYGGLLQAYALQKAVDHCGFQSKQISYILDSGYQNWNPIKYTVKKPLINLIRYVKYGKWQYTFEKRNKKLSDFADCIPHTKAVSAKKISKLSAEFDGFICGSDQIWNPIGWQPTFFLNFLPKSKKKVAYAASIARDFLTEDELKFMKQYLVGYSAISVREHNTADILNHYFSDFKIETMPDPVFLLDRSDWNNIKGLNMCEQPYIFAYFLGSGLDNREKAIQYAKESGLRLYIASHLDVESYCWEISHENKYMITPGIQEFLSAISNADLVLTDSFHAAAFSSIFRTPFYALPRFQVSDSNSMNSRLINLVNDLGIQDRYKECITAGEGYCWNQEELFNLENNLKRLREKGMRFLSNALND